MFPALPLIPCAARATTAASPAASPSSRAARCFFPVSRAISSSSAIPAVSSSNASSRRVMSRIALSGNAHAVREPFDDGTQRGQLDGLREGGVHPGLEACLAVALTPADGPGPAAFRLGPADLACRLETIDVGHLTVHQHEIVVTVSDRID